MKIECTLPNAAEEISGFKFAKSARGTMVSVDDIPKADAARLLSIDGYVERVGDDDKKAAEKAAAEKAAAEKAADKEAAEKTKDADAGKSAAAPVSKGAQK